MDHLVFYVSTDEHKMTVESSHPNGSEIVGSRSCRHTDITSAFDFLCFFLDKLILKDGSGNFDLFVLFGVNISLSEVTLFCSTTVRKL